MRRSRCYECILRRSVGARQRGATRGLQCLGMQKVLCKQRKNAKPRFFYRKSSVVKQPSTPFASGAVHARIRPGHNDGFLEREKITCNAQIESIKTQPPAGLEPATVRLRAVRSTD